MRPEIGDRGDRELILRPQSPEFAATPEMWSAGVGRCVGTASYEAGGEEPSPVKSRTERGNVSPYGRVEFLEEDKLLELGPGRFCSL